MTRNVPGTPGGNQNDDNQDDTDEQVVASAGETQHGSMIAAQDTSNRETREERARAAAAGDEHARAEQTNAEQTDAERTDAEHTAAGDGKPNRLYHAAEWLDGKLVPTLGAAELGPYDEESEESVASHDTCPLCGDPMAEHTIDRSTANAVLNCPSPQKPAPESFEPLNEVGMVKRDAADRP